MRIHHSDYSAEISHNKVHLSLGGKRYTWLNVGSALDTLAVQDIDEPLFAPEVTDNDDGTSLIWRTRSNVWAEKSYHWHFGKDLCWYQVEVRGSQTVRELRYFDGASGKESAWSFFDFSRFFTPTCALLDQRHYRSMQYGCIDATNGSDHPMDPHAACHWIFTPPPLCYALGFSSGPWLAAGVAPERGQYNFSRFEYLPGQNTYCFRLAYDGMTAIDGGWTSPRFVFLPAGDDYSALGRYCDILRTWKRVDENRHERADWWSKPIFCGWGEQNVTARLAGGTPTNALANQRIYDGFLGIIREKRLKPGTLVIDDKWQKQYGTLEVDTGKWPDLRAWIEARHAEGLRVLLWFGAWNPEGLPADEVIRDKGGGVVAADPTSPGYRRRIREYMHRMLSPAPGCLNADGLKFDWSNMPFAGEGYRTHGGVWGIELLKSLLQQVYDAGKAAKCDALIITHTANPYFAECTDMLRLNDIHVSCREVVSMMQHRRKIARAACPGALIDCDNSSAPGHTEWLEFTSRQGELGVPSLYFLTGFDGTDEKITDEDWERLAPIWRNGA